MPRTPTGASGASTEPVTVRGEGTSDPPMPAPSPLPPGARARGRRRPSRGAAGTDGGPTAQRGAPPPWPEPADPLQRPAGRNLVARRALLEIVRNAALGSYGVTSLAAPTRLARLRGRLGLGDRSVQVALQPEVTAQVWLEVAYGLPVAEVARQVDSAVRYELERAVGRAVGGVTVHVQGLAGQPFTSRPEAADEVTTDGSGAALSPVPDEAPADGAGPAGGAASRRRADGTSVDGTGSGERPA